MNSTGYSCVPRITKHRRHVRGKSCEQIEANVYVFLQRKCQQKRAWCILCHGKRV